MQKKLQEGGFLIWIAPAGGRDRRKADGTLIPDKFDPQAIEMMKKLGTKNSAAKTHFLSIGNGKYCTISRSLPQCFLKATYDIMPPPSSSEKDIGEKRIVNYTV